MTFLAKFAFALLGFQQESTLGDDFFAHPQTRFDFHPTAVSDAQNDFSFHESVGGFLDKNFRFATFVLVIRRNGNDQRSALADLQAGAHSHVGLEHPLWVSDFAADEQGAGLVI
jgi:hypothetical protein